jgi:hypothetical protein
MKNFIVSVAILFSLFACSTPQEPSPVVVFDETLLVNETGWNLSSEIRDDGVSKTDLSVAYAACVRDDRFNFLSDHTYTITEGSSKCDLNDLSVKLTGTWKLTSGMLTLTPTSNIPQPFTFATASTSFGLKKLTATEWIYTYIEVSSNGAVASTTTVTMNRIAVE